MHLVSSMAYTGSMPWHGLGNFLLSKQPLEVWAKQAGMDWQIDHAEVRYSPDEHNAAVAHSYPEQKVLYRSDTQAPLSVVSSRYQVVQPREVLEFYRDLTEVGGYELETAGVLKGGKKFWALARTGQSTRLRGGDEVNGYLLLATACDGTLATTAQFTSIRVVCNNTLAIALGASKGAVKVSHRSRFDPEAVKCQLGIATSSWDAFMTRIKALSECKVSPAMVERYYRRVLDRPEVPETPALPERSDRTLKALNDLFQGRGMGADLASASGTAWGMLSAVTQFVDHERRARSLDHRRDAAWFGAGAMLKQKAWEEALQLVA